MICPSCKSSEGSYQEIEDLDYELNYVYYTIWRCGSCYESVTQWGDGFEWEDDD